jgi:hypothetical protein
MAPNNRYQLKLFVWRTNHHRPGEAPLGLYHTIIKRSSHLRRGARRAGGKSPNFGHNTGPVFEIPNQSLSFSCRSTSRRPQLLAGRSLARSRPCCCRGPVGGGGGGRKMSLSTTAAATAPSTTNARSTPAGDVDVRVPAVPVVPPPPPCSGGGRDRAWGIVVAVSVARRRYIPAHRRR